MTVTLTPFPQILTNNLVKEIDFNLAKLVSIVQKLETSDLSNFGAGAVKDQQQKQLNQIQRAIKNYIVGRLVEAGFPLIPKELFQIKRYYEVHFLKDSSPVLNSVSAVCPKNPDYKTGDTYVRWATGNYLASVKLRSYKSAQLARLPYVGKRRTECVLRANLPSDLTLEAQSKKQKFLSTLLKIYSDLLVADVVGKYFNFSNSYYNNDFNLSLSESIVWAPKEEDIYITEEVIPEDKDPALVISWYGCEFLVDFWDSNTDDENLKPILDEFIV